MLSSSVVHTSNAHASTYAIETLPAEQAASVALASRPACKQMSVMLLTTLSSHSGGSRPARAHCITAAAYPAEVTVVRSGAAKRAHWVVVASHWVRVQRAQWTESVASLLSEFHSGPRVRSFMQRVRSLALDGGGDGVGDDEDIVGLFAGDVGCAIISETRLVLIGIVDEGEEKMRRRLAAMRRSAAQ